MFGKKPKQAPVPVAQAPQEDPIAKQNRELGFSQLRERSSRLGGSNSTAQVTDPTTPVPSPADPGTSPSDNTVKGKRKKVIQ